MRAKSSPVKIKKDALYKPLLRKFRTFVRKLFDGTGLAKGCHSWNADKMKTQVWSFMHVMELPACFKDMKTLCMMTILLFPNCIKKKKTSKLYLSELEHFFPEVKHCCYEIFLENNVKKRRAFFKEPLIRYLWKMFTELKPDVIIHHLRRTRSNPYDGEARYKAILEDIIISELHCNFKILPEQARQDSAITLFTPDEAEFDLIETGKFNRQTSE